ncbi:MAG: T9SS type A sorting domain-containing protein [Saprospiraceae bacterium]|uniref:T9SS type A sorting domain-containing protein n=1 Tax=Candidatus Opimibacter skivensis TaxID=2982028 RepID=A0A9D7T108_9BACT|nr:T9SS type A sorting domain-containing protein [Candidatus Opimibacter skivensis]
MKSSFQILVIIIGLAYPICAQHGNLDSTFNINGRVTTNFPNFGASVSAGGLQSDGKIIAAGTVAFGNNAYFGVARYNTNGTLDTTFGLEGKAIIQIGSQRDYMRDLSIQPDDKILIVGITLKDTNSHIALLRLLPNGVLDSAFGINGVTILALEGRDNNGTSIALQSDGKIVLAGFTYSPNTDALVYRFTPEGIPDSSFGTFGKIVTVIPFVSNGANDIVIQHDGKIVIGGFVGSAHNNVAVYDFSLMRFNENGTPDSTFNEDGIVRTSINQWVDQISQLAIQPDGKIIAAGYTNSGDPNHTNYEFVVARYNEDGTLDMDFGTDGLAVISFGTEDDRANSVAIQSDGKIVAVGYTSSWQESDFAIARFHPDGSLDSGWGIGGKLTTDFNSSRDGGYSVVIQPDGKIIAFGFTDNEGPLNFALVRYLPELFMGVLDFSAVHDILIYPNPIQENFVLEYTLIKDETLTIEIVDMFGRSIQVLASRVSKLTGPHKESFHLGKEILPGNYVVRISNQHGSINIKVIKE